MGVQASLDARAPQLLVPGRRLLKSGYLDKVRQYSLHSSFLILTRVLKFLLTLTRNQILIQMPTSQPRHFWLFNDLVVYAKPSALNRLSQIVDGSPAGLKRGVNENSKFIFCCALPLRHCKVERFAGRNMFRVCLFFKILVLGLIFFSVIVQNGTSYSSFTQL